VVRPGAEGGHRAMIRGWHRRPSIAYHTAAMTDLSHQK
jgi:hypothetical protein